MAATDEAPAASIISSLIFEPDDDVVI